VRKLLVPALALALVAATGCSHKARPHSKRAVVFAVYSVKTDASALARLHVSGGGFARARDGRIALIRGRPPFERPTQLVIMDDDGSHLRVLTNAGQGWDTPAPPAWSPDGRVLAVADGPPADCAGGVEDQCISRISLVDARTGVRRATIRGVEDPSWSPDGKRLAFDTIYVNPPCGSCPTSPVHVFVSRSNGRDVRRIARGGLLSWSPAGGLIAYYRGCDGGKGSLQLIRPDGSRDRRVGPCHAFQWSPDGTRVAVPLPCRDYLDECFGIMSLRTGHVRRITRVGMLSGGPAWSPDGSTLAWSSWNRATDEDRLLIAPSDGSAKPRELYRTPPRFRLDEKSLIFTSYGERVLFTLYGVR
jgi:Tol biopolymer transport system component